MTCEGGVIHRDREQAEFIYGGYMRDTTKAHAESLHCIFDSLEEAQRATISALTVALKTRDAETYEHSTRVVGLSLLLGREHGFNEAQMRALEFGALLHDIGKIGVPDAILHKPARLTAAEWVVMRRHPQQGERILDGIGFLETASRVVGQHHEKWDGTGYPLGLREEEIDLNARILAVADAFDAMISDRVYRARRSYEATVEELDRCAGEQFDPAVVEAFHRVPHEDWRELCGEPCSLLSTNHLTTGVMATLPDSGSRRRLRYAGRGGHARSLTAP